MGEDYALDVDTGAWIQMDQGKEGVEESKGNDEGGEL